MLRFIDFINEIYEFGSEQLHKREFNRWGFELELCYNSEFFNSQEDFINFLSDKIKIDLEYSDDVSITPSEEKFKRIEIKSGNKGLDESEINKLNLLSKYIDYLSSLDAVEINDSCGLHFHINMKYKPTVFDQIAALVEIDEQKFYNIYPEREINIYAANKKTYLQQIINIWKVHKENFDYEKLLNVKYLNISLLFQYTVHKTAEFRLLPARAIFSENITDMLKYALGLIDHVKGRQIIKWKDEINKTYWFYRKENGFIISETPLKDVEYSERIEIDKIYNTRDFVDITYNLITKLLDKKIEYSEFKKYIKLLFKNEYIFKDIISKIFTQKELLYFTNYITSGVTVVSDSIKNIFLKKYNININLKDLEIVKLKIIIDKLKNQIDDEKYLKFKRFFKMYLK